MMKNRLAVTFLLCASVSYAQQAVTRKIDSLIQRHEAEGHLTFLASDEMRGRDTGSKEINIAANYIRAQFKIHNVPPAPTTDDYFQYVGLVKYAVPVKGTASVGEQTFTLKDDMLVIEGSSVAWDGEFVYVGYGSPEELAKHDVNGKMVLALAGSKEADNINKVYSTSIEKFQTVKKLGAKGLVEILAFPQVPWPALVDYLSKDRWSIEQGGSTVPFVWLRPKNLRDLSFKNKKTVKGSLSVTAPEPRLVQGRNVAAIVEGTDPKLKDQYVVITAHYDHIGVDPSLEGDSIFNGARDNATGTVALIQTAKYLANNPPRRSVVLVAVTSEEKGLLGSRWYVSHPLVPLKKTVLNINCDGVGYNDKKRVTSISLGRTNTDDQLRKAAAAYNFMLGGDPDPREGFYERSDQVSFARAGVPGIKLQPGLSEMNDEILRYYHRTADEVSTLDLNYLTQFYRTFVLAVHFLANDDLTPAWVPGDKFEEAAKKLHAK